MKEKIKTLREKQVFINNNEVITDITPIDIFISTPNTCSNGSLTKDDVWGQFNIKTGERLTRGMIVARYNEECPIWGDVLPYKSVTVKCLINQEDEVIYWLDYVYGCDSVQRRKVLKNGMVALRAEYQCW